MKISPVSYNCFSFNGKYFEKLSDEKGEPVYSAAIQDSSNLMLDLQIMSAIKKCAATHKLISTAPKKAAGFMMSPEVVKPYIGNTMGADEKTLEAKTEALKEAYIADDFYFPDFENESIARKSNFTELQLAKTYASEPDKKAFEKEYKASMWERFINDGIFSREAKNAIDLSFENIKKLAEYILQKH